MIRISIALIGLFVFFANALGQPPYGKPIDYVNSEHISERVRTRLADAKALTSSRNTAESGVKILEKIATDSSSSSFERAIAYSLIGNTISFHSGYGPDEREANKLRAIEAYEKSISTGGLNAENVEYLKWRIDQVLLDIGRPIQYHKPPQEAERLVTAHAEIPNKFLNGPYSGYCSVWFNLTKEGLPTRVWLTDCTDKTLEKPTLNAVNKWRYEPFDNARPDIVRSNLRERVAFHIWDENDERLPYPFVGPRDLKKRRDKYFKRYKKLKKKWDKEDR